MNDKALETLEKQAAIWKAETMAIHKVKPIASTKNIGHLCGLIEDLIKELRK